MTINQLRSGTCRKTIRCVSAVCEQFVRMFRMIATALYQQKFPEILR